jgi:lipopolysaccharide export system protein LptC
VPGKRTKTKLAGLSKVLPNPFRTKRRNPNRDGYSNFVGWMKLALPTSAFLIIMLVILWPNFTGTKKQVANITRDSFDASLLRNFEMLAPVFFGTDEKNRPYRLRARKARQSKTKASIVSLEEPRANLKLDKGKGLIVSAKSGKLDQKKNVLQLRGNVNIYHDANYTMRTQLMTVNLKDREAWGSKPVSVRGPKAKIDAQGFRILDKGQTVIFTGKTRVVLNMDKQDMREITGETGGQ